MGNMLMLGVQPMITPSTVWNAVTEDGQVGSVTQTSLDSIPYGIDFTALLATGDAVTSPDVTVYSVNAGVYLDASVNVSHVGIFTNAVHLTVADMAVSQLLRIQVTVMLNTNKIVSSWFLVYCPF
jgi:hypothetical protein